MQIDPPLKCPHCGAELSVVTTGKPAVYIALCPKRAVVEHPTYIYAPTVEIK